LLAKVVASNHTSLTVKQTSDASDVLFGLRGVFCLLKPLVEVLWHVHGAAS